MSKKETIQLFGTVDDSIVDGEGIRLSIFVQGCPHHCKGCHNPESHSFDGGKGCFVDDICRMVDGNPLLDGITLTGGEPFCQSAQCLAIAKHAKEKGLNVWTYTGYTYEQLVQKSEVDESVKGLLDVTDVLVDGRFELEERSLDILFRGSRNQRLIDMNATRETGTIVLWEQKE